MADFKSGQQSGAAKLAALALLCLTPAAARSYTPEQQEACSGDAMQLCASEIPDIDRITACMVRNKAQLSPPCRAQFDGDRGGASADDPLQQPVDIRPAATRKAASGKSNKSKKPAKHEPD